MVVLKVYAGMVWTGPGRSYWSERLTPHGRYAQVHHENIVAYLVPDWFAQLASEAKTLSEELYILQEVRRFQHPHCDL